MARAKLEKHLTDLTPLEQNEIIDGLKEIYDSLPVSYRANDYLLFYFSDFQKEFFFIKNKELENQNFEKCISNKNIRELFSETGMNINQSFWRYRRDDYISALLLDSQKEQEQINKARAAFPYSGIEEYTRFYEFRETNPMDEYETLKYLNLYSKMPQIEQLLKSGFQWFVYEHTGLREGYRHSSASEIELFSRNFKKGKNLSEITGLPNYAIKLLQDSRAKDDIRLWNEYRIWIQKENLSREGLESILNIGIYNTNDFSKMRRLCNQTYEGEKIYTISTLANYLERVDMYQAIGLNEAIVILEDYFRMCRQMGVKPVKDSNSLKREHDVTARNHRNWMLAQKAEFVENIGVHIEERADELSKYIFENDEYVVVLPRSVQDFINEGNQNHNCVGSYAERFAKGKSNIFFVRKKQYPEHSYITTELTGDCTSYRQAFLSGNRHITQQKDWDFINGWLDNNRLVNEGKVQSKDLSTEKKRLTSIREQIADAEVRADAHNAEVNLHEPDEYDLEARWNR